MKFFRITVILLGITFIMRSCDQKRENRWDIVLKNEIPKVKMIDISEKLYDKNIDLKKFRKEFPWYGGSDEFLLREKDAREIEIYKEAISKINISSLNQELGRLFAHIDYYFPKFRPPEVCLYSSALQDILSPVTYDMEQNMVFIDISAFMGEGNENYKSIDLYLRRTMNDKNIIPKVSMAFAESIVAVDRNRQKFLDLLVYEGKIMMLQDAFLPDTPNDLKINYTARQHEWAETYESDIWNFFVENNLLFSDDEKLSERFIAPGPFSKFYTETDRESSPQIGVFMGWKICQAYFEQNSGTKLTEFLKLDTETIFNRSLYKGR